MRWWSHWSTRSLHLAIDEGKVSSAPRPPYCLGNSARYYVQLHRTLGRHHSQTKGSVEYNSYLVAVEMQIPLHRLLNYYTNYCTYKKFIKFTH